jgi:hypothetical protein
MIAAVWIGWFAGYGYVTPVLASSRLRPAGHPCQQDGGDIQPGDEGRIDLDDVVVQSRAVHRSSGNIEEEHDVRLPRMPASLVTPARANSTRVKP